jgi:type I restriction enzyme, S subunit
MQQLFPREGETVPRLRFPEFRDAGEWKSYQLGHCLSRHPEYGINAAAVPYSENLPTYLRITDISEEGQIRPDQRVSVAKEVTDENYLEDGDIVLARTGASVGKSYKYRPEDGRLVFAGFLIRVRPNEKKLNSELLFQFLSTEQYWRWVGFCSARSGQPGINGSEYASLPIQLPPTLKEQQKIASCLSSIDDLINSQNQKCDALKTHKKGLMQQLFPSAEADGE